MAVFTCFNGHSPFTVSLKPTHTHHPAHSIRASAVSQQILGAHPLCVREPEDEAGLFRKNAPIMDSCVEGISYGAKIFVATNPPVELAGYLREANYYSVHPLRSCTDDLRSACGDHRKLNKMAFDTKGFTQWSPGYACAKEILEELS